MVGTYKIKEKYVSDKISGRVKDVEELSEIAKEEPHVAYCAFTKGLCRRWAYVQRTIGIISSLFEPLERTIRECFIPAIVGKSV